MRTLLICLISLFSIRCCYSEDILEISSTDAPLFLTVTLYDSDSNEIKSETIKGRGYEWYSLPPNADNFRLKTLGVPTEPLKLLQNTNTYVRVKALPPTQYNVTTQTGIESNVVSKTRLAAGKIGYVFVGSLNSLASDSVLKSLFIADANGKRLYGIHMPDFTLSNLKALVDNPENIFTIDFPLYLRPAIGAPSVEIARAGQKIRIQSLYLKPGTLDYFAKVTIL